MIQQVSPIDLCLSILKRRYPYMLGAFAVVLITATLITIWLPPIYRSQARILVQSQQIPSNLVRSTVTALADERIQVIKQRITTRDTILDLSRKFDLFPNRRDKLSVTQLVELIRERIDISIYDIGTRAHRRSDQAFTIAFTVAFEYEKPQAAASVANELVTLILNEDVKSRTSRATETTLFLERETQRLQRELVTVEQQIARFKSENSGALPSQLRLHQAALTRLEQQRLELARDIRAADDKIRFLEFELSIRTNNSASLTGSQEPDAMTDTSPRRRLQLLQSQLDTLLIKYSDKHPDIRAIKAQISGLEKQIANTPEPEVGKKSKLSPEELEKLDVQSRMVAEKISAIKSRKELLVAQQKQQSVQISDLQALIARVPEVENGLAILERQRNTTQKALSEISDKLADARLGERLEADQQAERLQVIEQPVSPQNPIKPNRKKLMALGFALAVAAAGGTVLGLESLDTSVKGTSDLLSTTNKRPLVVLPYIKTRRQKRQRRMRIMAFIVILILVTTISLVGVHFLFMPLDVLIPKVMHRLQL